MTQFFRHRFGPILAQFGKENPQCSSILRLQPDSLEVEEPVGEVDPDVGGEEQGPGGGEGKGATSRAGDEATAELGVTAAAATVVAPIETSAGESKAEDETEEKLSFLLKNSSLLLAFLLLVEGLDLFFTRVCFTLLSLVSREKEKVELTVRLKLKSLPWLASACQKARH